MTTPAGEPPEIRFTSEEPMAPGTDPFTSYEPMTPGKDPRKKLPSMRERAQRGLGWVIVGTAMLSYLLVVIFYLWDLTETSNQLEKLVTSVFAGLQTLVAAVIGFYFGSQEKEQG